MTDVKCRISGGELVEVMNMGSMFISDFVKNDESPRGGKEEMKLLLCEDSGLLQMEKTVDPDLMYGKYWYKSGVNDSMTRELYDISRSCIDSIPTNVGDVFLDIASNDGTLLSSVPSDRFTRIGIDPCKGSIVESSRKHADHIVQDYFTSESYWSCAKNKAKIITTIAMFYDLDDPKKFLDDVYDVMDDEGLFVVQLSYTPLMLKQLAFDNICHEHICFYSLTSMKYVLDRCGFKIVDCQFNDVNGGSFRVYIRKNIASETNFKTSPYRDVANYRIQSILEYEKTLGLNDPQVYIDFYDEICNLRDETVDFIKTEKLKGKTIWGYGASTKGNTLLQWYGLDENLIDGIAERNPEKYGHRTVGTNIPIYSEEYMRKVNPDYLLILPWHFIHEFSLRESEYLDGGGSFIVPCPKFEVITK